jgi:hypothetical protein
MGEFTEISPQDLDECELMPWWLGRMSHDSWPFGLLLVTNQVICIERINRIWRDTRGTMWIDVTLLKDAPSAALKLKWPCPCFLTPTSRLDATINTDHVVAAFELADA